MKILWVEDDPILVVCQRPVAAALRTKVQRVDGSVRRFGVKARESSLFMQAQMNPVAAFAVGPSVFALTFVLNRSGSRRAR